MRRELVNTEAEREAAESDYELMGWEVVARSPNRSGVERGLRGGWGWHLLYFLIAPVVGNLAYSAYRRYNRPEKIVIRIRGGAESDAPADTGEDAVEEEDDGESDDGAES